MGPALAIGLACLVMWLDTPSHHVTVHPATLAYRAGYGELFKKPSARKDQTTLENVYVQTPGSEWHETADARITRAVKEIERDCDPFTPIGRATLLELLPQGDWEDYVAGGEQALQDNAAGLIARTTTPPGYHGVDCD